MAQICTKQGQSEEEKIEPEEGASNKRERRAGGGVTGDENAGS